MKFELTELTDINEIYKTYDVYKYCMFNPTVEKFEHKIISFLKDNFVKIFTCIVNGETAGVVVISFEEQNKAEIIGIAVAVSFRNQGVASYMIKQIAEKYSLMYISAETDKDAVGFYRNNGFYITEFLEVYDGETVTRYRCELIR